MATFVDRVEPLREIGKIISNHQKGYLIGQSLVSIVASPGSGKTALLEELARTYEGGVRVSLIDCGTTPPEDIIPRDPVDLVLLDNLDRLVDQDGHLPPALDKQLTTLVSSDQIVVVTTNQVPVNFREFALRQRLIERRLELLSQEELVVLLATDYPAVEPNRVYRLTIGHPDSALETAKILTLNPNTTDTEILNILIANFERDIPPELQPTLSFLSPPRQFICAVGHCLEVLPTQQDAPFLMLYEKLKATSLVWWSIQRRGYQLDPSLRHMHNTQALLTDPDKYYATHAKLATFYLKSLQYQPEEPTCFVEYLYHLAQSKTHTALQLIEIITTWLGQTKADGKNVFLYLIDINSPYGKQMCDMELIATLQETGVNITSLSKNIRTDLMSADDYLFSKL